MTKIFNTVILILAFGCLGPHPAPAISRQYQLGSTYEYEYETSVQLNENPSSGREVGYKVTAKVKVTNVWQNPVDPSEKLLKLEMIGAKLLVHSVHTKDHHLEAHSSPLDKSTSQPAYLHWVDGRASRIYMSADKDDLTSDLKRGLASLFQVKLSGNEATSTMVEEDVSGRCQVSYVKKDSSHMEKRKWGCRHLEVGEFSHPNYAQSVTTDSQTTLLYELFPDTRIKHVEAQETVQLLVNMWQKASVQVRVSTILNYVSERVGRKTVQVTDADEAVKTLNQKMKYGAGESLARSFPQITECEGLPCKSLDTVVKEYRERLKIENLAKVKSANAFLRVLERMRTANAKEIESVLKDTKNKKVLPQLLDVAAAAQTPAALSAGLATVDFKNPDIAERFILCLGLASHPDENLISQLLAVLQKNVVEDKVKTSLLTTLGAVIRTHCQVRGGDQGCGVAVKKAIDYLLNSLAVCKDDLCRGMYLRGLLNAGMPETVPALIPYMIRGGKLGSVAIRALKRIGGNLLNETTVRELVDVYHQLRRPYDSTCRTLAAEVLLSTHSTKHPHVLRDLIYSLSNQHTPEVNTFTLAKLLELAESNNVLRKSLRQVAQDPVVWNYYTLAQKGSSTSFSRLFGESSGMNATYGINMELLPGGVLKRSSFDVGLQSGDSQRLLLLSVGLYAEGIGSFAGSGGEDENEAEQEETSAGMELSAFDIRLRPYKFFTGTGELMGLVWAGTGSEPTPALQANLLMNDHQETLALHNGLPIELSLRGALSTDLSGSIQISLWNRNSHSLVKTSGALLLHGAARVTAPFAKAHVEFAMGGEAYVDFVTDLNFYEKPFKMCIQMDQQPFSFRYNVRKAESVPNSKHLVRTLRKRTFHVTGKSYAMHRKNMDTCAIMLEES